jgi:hypothetical protein
MKLSKKTGVKRNMIPDWSFFGIALSVGVIYGSMLL